MITGESIYVFLHFDMAFVSTGPAGSLSKVEKKSKLKA